ncbi:hypothetical protein BSKO_02866 [Bryopsis sp. KO-2023]|nr:hypothetical protein BSKO_02866 [Bryopsis sp. KO-2023]
MASATQSRGDAVEEDELCNPQEGSMRDTGSRLKQSLKEVDSESDGINSLKVALDAKDAHLHSVLERLEENNRCISANDALIKYLQASLEKNVAQRVAREHEIEAVRGKSAQDANNRRDVVHI